MGWVSLRRKTGRTIFQTRHTMQPIRHISRNAPRTRRDSATVPLIAAPEPLTSETTPACL
jgi:hypothetical protein